ncbi:quinone-dependent dihydroorotate dehydrogenase [Pseudomonas sp. 10B1]|uniref:quinone-dependent dihydroorotate dehydrogenase n=1 Tax=unclassified Pseudomonas TaxID=196821 RepID=UPI002AB49C8A|nr:MULTISPECIES: quinone-dependent dihydroorotate dehydrogenase [unclassified Pseudomonas]MDY7560507.1 quinone-dependent dihydroorotate dehydrogenase [Pseudomonas sp. AB6]MEA9975899.1 quinone-dependent dihydroorotate dehydrogenase [Pseudomonas sp. RTS4]MEA9993264.1 quinone-dependent dihydroorotate dehydrogenase [Pseudomonas sp. AA4]MEB0088135.1 quinone-dependent dihydroorotate dehydrogenase [Pseudomonas sp. RTI1]MEB0124249.1 quinone-dependent dihydroorotate dehydrogenase [Pseudomonas sp. CCC1.
MYNLARQLLFKLSPETSHDLSLDLIGAGGRLGLNGLLSKAPAQLPVRVMGLNFPNPVGLAAGLDKNGTAIVGFAQLGFGFVEVGTVTPRPQPGNPKPRIFRLPHAEAIINRMGFNNLGVDHLITRVKAARYGGILGINIGKNVDTPVERAVDDYLICLDKVYEHASYVTVNVSSPNTPGLRSLQFGDSLKQLLEALRLRQEDLAMKYGRRVPLAIKIAPDMTDEETVLVAAALIDSGMDAVIATNTTLSRKGVEGMPYADEVGGLSGAPVREKSTHTVKVLAGELAGRLPIIAAGGITEGRHAAEKIAAGASLVQIYSGFIYKGPALIGQSVDAIAAINRR